MVIEYSMKKLLARMIMNKMISLYCILLSSDLFKKDDKYTLKIIKFGFVHKKFLQLKF